MARATAIEAGAAWGTDPLSAKAAGAIVLAAAGVVGASLLGEWALNRNTATKALQRGRQREPAKGLHAAAALLSASVLADSAVEHYRAMFENPGMYTPLAVSMLSLLAGADGVAGGWLPTRLRNRIYGLAAAVGVAGLGFHLYNVTRKPGGFGWLNLFYAAPIGAPAALSLAGAIGVSAGHLETTPESRRPKLLGVAAGRALSALTSLGLLGTVCEASLLHFRGSFQNPFMWLPVSLPPVSALLMGKAAVERTAPSRRPLTRAWLGLTAALGLVGVGFHAYGVSRAMGGWRNWTQNLIDGPPLPAPPSFSALAIAAFSALSLREREDG